jgi:hypothetical protein
MGTCILCGAAVVVDSGRAWKIVPATDERVDAAPTHWIHSGCIDRAHAATLRDTTPTLLRPVA